MDALTARQYLPVLLVLAGLGVVAIMVALIVARRAPIAPREPIPAEPVAVLPNVMLILAAVALAAALVVLLPAMIALTYFQHWQVAALLIAAAALPLVPLAWLWRARRS